MGRRAQVCGAPTAIALDAERVGSGWRRGCVLHTTENTVVLRSGENSLQALDAQRFCAGSVDVRHVVELPRSVTFSKRNWGGNYGVAWGNKRDDDGESSGAVYIVDCQAGEVTARAVPDLNEQVADAFLDLNGEQVAAVGATTGKLYCWSRSNWDHRGSLEATSRSEWRVVDGVAVDTAAPVDLCSRGRFMSSAVMGNCFVYLRARRDTSGSAIVEKWLFDVDARWTPVIISSRTMGASASDADSAEGLALFMTEKWKSVVLTVGSTLYHFQVDQDLRNSSVKRLALDHRVLDGAWVHQDAAFAMLLANGQISIANISDTGTFELLAITTSSTISKRLSLSALLGKAVSAALQLAWVAQEKQLVVDFGSSCAAFELEIVADESSSSICDDSNNSIELLGSRALAQSNRRIITRLDKKFSEFDDCIHDLLEGKSSPSSNDLLDVAKIALTQNHRDFEDLYFTLLRLIHQQLAGDSVNNGNSRDPIDCIGKSLKLMEVLISFTISLGAPILRQISSKILAVLPGCTTKFDRKLYYRKEIAAVSQQVRKLRSGVNESEDWWIYSTEATAFLRVYFIRIRALLQEIRSGDKLVPGEASQIFSLCQRIIEHGDWSSGVESIVNAERSSDPLIEQLKGLIASYTIICCCLHVNGVMVDLEHFFSLVPSIVLKRKEFLCCFLKPWLRLSDDSESIIAGNKAAVCQASRLATKSNTMQLLLNVCMANRSLVAHSCVQALVSVYAIATEIETSSNDVLKVNNLHWQACEAYIGETMTILRRIGARRQFKYSNREAECNIGRISVAIGADFDDYHRSLSAELARTTGKTHCAASSMNTLWEFSHLDKRLRARVICLISRIVWHLEAASEDVGSLFQRAFVLNLFDAQMESFAEEHDKLHVCITKMRAIINPEETELRLPRFRKPEEVQPGLSLRSQKIARSLVLMAWALWLREKAADCSRGAHIVKMKGETNETEMLGALAATCALHLNALGKVYGANEEHLSIQLSLLEDAAVMNPSKTAAVIAWGFPAQKILTRHLKRYNVLRQVIQHSSRSMSVEECEQHFQKLQKHMRRAFHRSRDNLQNAEPTHNENSDIDVLVDCCCDPECLQIMSVVTKYPFKVVATSTSVPGRSHPLRTPEVVSQEDLRDNVEQLLPSTDPDQTPISTTGQVLLEPQISISRDEVIALLQAQTRHLEEKIHAVTVVGKSRPSSSYEDGHDAGIEKTVPTLDQGKQRSTSEKRVDTTGEDVVALADVQRMARISLQVRDLSRHRYSSAVSEVENQTNPLAKPSHRHNSVRNALKLFRLRQENCGHTSSEPGGSKTANENGTPNTAKSVNPTLDIETSHDNRSPAAVMSRREKLKRAGIKKSSRNQRSSESPSFPAKEPVYSLRLEYGIDNASLKLLGRNSEQRNPSVRRKQFVHQERERLPKAYARTSAAINATVVESAQVIQLKTISAQTNDPIEDDVSPVSAAKETKDIGPEKRSPMTQECDVAHCSVAVNTSNSQKSKGIQCGVPENGPTNSGRRKQGPPPLSIADKYPIWVDLDEANNVGSRSHFKERKKFLQVARFGSPNASDATANNDASDNSAHTTMLPSVSTVLVPRKVNSDDGSDENQSDGQHSPSLSNSQAHEDDTLEQIGDSMKTRYRARYRQQYPVQERPSSRKSDDREGASAINSLIDLRDNMQRMTQRLRVLETCANSIDEEFKVSQKRLSQIGDMRPDDISSQERVLADIDEVLKMTEDASSQASARKPREGLLSKKASSDFDAAKKLLASIEQLSNDQ